MASKFGSKSTSSNDTSQSFKCIEISHDSKHSPKLNGSGEQHGEENSEISIHHIIYIFILYSMFVQIKSESNRVDKPNKSFLTEFITLINHKYTDNND